MNLETYDVFTVFLLKKIALLLNYYNNSSENHTPVYEPTASTSLSAIDTKPVELP